MKTKILLVLLLCGVVSMTNAQDFELKSADPEAMSKIRLGGANLFFINLEATDDVPRRSEFLVEYAWGDDKLDDVREEIDLEDKIDEGDDYSYGFSLDVDETDAEDGDEVVLTLVMSLEDDINPDNDTIRLTYVVSDDQSHRDLQVVMTSPAQNAIWNYNVLQTISLDITNVGEATFETGTELFQEFFIGGQAATNPSVVTYAGDDLETGETGQINLSTTLTNQIPANTYEICIRLRWAESDGTLVTFKETFSGDNLGCNSIILEENVGIDEGFADLNSFFYQNGQIVLEMSNKSKSEAYDVVVYDLTGRQVAGRQIQTSMDATQKHVIEASGLKPGVYVISFTTEGKFVGSEKLMVR